MPEGQIKDELGELFPNMDSEFDTAGISETLFEALGKFLSAVGNAIKAIYKQSAPMFSKLIKGKI